MLSYVILALVIANRVDSWIGSSSVGSSCDVDKQNATNIVFERLSIDVIDLDKMVNTVCKNLRPLPAQEQFAGTSFRLEVKLPEFNNAHFIVKIKHRVIYINGHYPRESDCDLTYVDIKILPDIVDTHGGAWIFKDGHLIVAFPYKTYTENDINCLSDIDETLIDLRKGSSSEIIFRGD